MSQITQIQQTTPFPPIVQQSTNGSPALKKHLLASIIHSISEFGSKPVNSQRVSKEWRELFSNDPILNLHNSKITDKELIEIIEKRKDVLTDVDLSNCENITYESMKHLSKLKNLKSLDLRNANIRLKDLSDIESLIQLPKLKKLFTRGGVNFEDSLKDISLKHMFAEKVAMKQFIQEKSAKFGITCYCDFLLTPKVWMGSRFSYDRETVKIDSKNCGILVNPLLCIPTKYIDSFLIKYPNFQDDIKKFLTDKNPAFLDSAARNLITMFNRDFKDAYNKFYSLFGIAQYFYTLNNLEFNLTNISLAKQILTMHAIGKLDEFKRFDLTHELGHVCYNIYGNKSLGDFDPLELPFIKPHQYGEVRADLTAAREGDAHEFGITVFEFEGIFLKDDQDLFEFREYDPHPSGANRAKVLQIDLEKILKEKTKSVTSTV